MPGQQVFILRPSFCRNSRRERTSLKKFFLSGRARACAAFFSPPCRRTVRRQSAPASEKTLHSKLRFFGKPGLASSKRRRKFSVKTRQKALPPTHVPPLPATAAQLALHLRAGLEAQRLDAGRPHAPSLQNAQSFAESLLFRGFNAVLLRERRLTTNKKKESRHTVTTPKWSGRLDLNQRLSAPKADALPLRHAPNIKKTAAL